MKLRLTVLCLILFLVSGLAFSGLMNRWMNKLTQQDPPFETFGLEYQFKSDLMTVHWSPETVVVKENGEKADKLLRPSKVVIYYTEYIVDHRTKATLAEESKVLTVLNKSRVGTKNPTFTWEISK